MKGNKVNYLILWHTTQILIGAPRIPGYRLVPTTCRWFEQFADIWRHSLNAFCAQIFECRLFFLPPIQPFFNSFSSKSRNVLPLSIEPKKKKKPIIRSWNKLNKDIIIQLQGKPNIGNQSIKYQLNNEQIRNYHCGWPFTLLFLLHSSAPTLSSFLRKVLMWGMNIFFMSSSSSSSFKTGRLTSTSSISS